MENLKKVIVENLPCQNLEHLTSDLIKLKLAKENISYENKKNVRVSLSTLGKSLEIAVKPEEKKVFFDEKKLDNYQVNVDESLNGMKKLTNFIRSSAGQDSVSPNYYEHMHKKGNILKPLYKNGVYKFDVEKQDKKEDRPVVWADAESLVDKVVKERQLIGNYQIKLMADGGQNFFKISTSIIPESYFVGNDISDSKMILIYYKSDESYTVKVEV